MKNIIKALFILLAMYTCLSCGGEKEEVGEITYLPDSVQLYQHIWDSLDIWAVPPRPKVDTITIVGVGDVMMGTNYPSKVTLPPQDGNTLFDGVRSFLTEADVTFGNLEGAIGNGGTAKRSA